MLAIPILMAFAYFGGTFDPSWTNAPSKSRIYPIGYSSVYRMEKPDGSAAVFRLKGDVLVGERPWVGSKDKNRIDIWTDPTLMGGKVRTGYTFISGQLRHMEIDGKAYNFPGGAAFGEGAFEKMYPVRKARSWEKGSAGDLWKKDGGRLRLWFANPNSAGLLLAEVFLLIAGLFVVPKVRGWVLKGTWVRKVCVFGVGATAAVLALYGVLKTGSRGALVGLGVGVLCMGAAYAKVLFTKRGILWMLVGVVLFVGAICVSGQGARLVQTFQKIDAGNMLRLKVARAATEMLADAPQGWKGGEVPARGACLNWYLQDEDHIIRTHLMTVTELGWAGGFAYFLGWFLLMGLGAREMGRGNPLVMAFFAAFFVAGFLNPVYRDWELWVLPGMVAAGCLLSGKKSEGWRKAPQFMGGAIVCAGLMMAALVVCGRYLPRQQVVRVKAEGAATLVNVKEGKPAIWVVEDTAVLGGFGFPGREIVMRMKKDAELSMGYVYDVKDLPKEVETLVLPGRAAADFLKMMDETGAAPCVAKRIVFVSPMAKPEDVPDELLRAMDVDVEWHVGSLAVLRAMEDYQEKCGWVYIHPGCELYLPNWIQIAQKKNRISIIQKG